MDLWCDMTGVGRSALEIVRRYWPRVQGVTITAGRSEQRSGLNWNVSKEVLVTTTQARVHDGTLKLAAGMGEIEAVLDELASFRMRYTATGSTSFEGASGKHDDLVISLCLATGVCTK